MVRHRHSIPFFLLLSACGGDRELPTEPLIPCAIQGTLLPGATASGHLGGASCAGVSDIPTTGATYFTRWGLRIHPDTVYIVSARFLSPGDGTSWDGKLLAYSVEDADTLLRTGFWGWAHRTDGDVIEEMLVADTASRQLIIHLEGLTLTDSGNYQLEVRRCPMLTLAPGVATPPTALGDSCLLWTPGTPGRALFFQYTNAAAPRQVEVAQVGGSETLYYAWASAPRLNFACWYAAGSCDLGLGGTTTFAIHPHAVDGITAGALFTLGPAASVTLVLETVP